jgi:cell wall-associated NlpC family hydrolase
MPATMRGRRAAALPVLLTVILVGSMLTHAAPAEAAPNRSQRIVKALSVVRAQLGDPYRYGSAGPSSFDCSGLVYYSYRKAGLKNVPRTSSQQAKTFRPVKRNDMRKGDLVFFHRNWDVYHMGVFVGWKNGRRMIIHASRPGTPVKLDPIWTNTWFARTLR